MPSPLKERMGRCCFLFLFGAASIFSACRGILHLLFQSDQRLWDGLIVTSNLELVVSLCFRPFGFAYSGGPLGPFLMTFSGLFLCCSSSLELVFLTLFLSANLSLLPFFHRILLRHFQRETLLTDIFGDQFFGFCLAVGLLRHFQRETLMIFDFLVWTSDF